MTKKHFIALANYIRDSQERGVHWTPEHLDILAAFCRAENSNFMRARWLDYIAGACGPNGGKR